MTYRMELQRLAASLSGLLIDGAQVGADDLEIAMVAHAAVLDLAEMVHLEVASTSWSGDWADVRSLEVHPVVMMRRHLHAHARIQEWSLTDVLTLPRRSEAGSRWEAAAVSATVAHAHWTQTRPGQFDGPAAWTEMADIAAISEAVVLLDDDVAASLSAAGRPKDAERFRSSALAGLRITSREVGLLAANGPLRPTEPYAMLPGVPLEIDSAMAVREGFRRLGAWLAYDLVITPPQAEIMLRVLAEASLAGASALTGHADDLARSLLDHADRVSKTLGISRHAYSTHRGDPTPAHQAAAIHGWLEEQARHKIPMSPGEARRLAEVIPPTTWRLGAAVLGQVSDLNWRFGPGEEPALLMRSDAAQAFRSDINAMVLGSAEVELELRRLPPKSELVNTPRVILAEALRGRRTPPRPAIPGRPVHGPVRRRKR